jgi:hypothetical protein
MKNIHLVCFLALAASGVNPVGASDSTPDALTEQVIIDRDPVEDAAVEALDAAQVDLKRGEIIIIRYGHPSFTSDRVVEEMKSQFGIVLKKAGCVSTDISIAYATVYNAVMQRAILAKFGKTLTQIERSVEANQTLQRTPGTKPDSSAESDSRRR